MNSHSKRKHPFICGNQDGSIITARQNGETATKSSRVHRIPFHRFVCQDSRCMDHAQPTPEGSRRLQTHDDSPNPTVRRLHSTSQAGAELDRGGRNGSFRNRNGPARPSADGRTRPARTLPGRGVAGAGGGEMTMVSSKAAKDNALFGRIRQSSRCQQEEQLRAAAAVGGYHEIGWSSRLRERRGQRTHRHGDRKGRLGLRQQP